MMVNRVLSEWSVFLFEVEPRWEWDTAGGQRDWEKQAVAA